MTIIPYAIATLGCIPAGQPLKAIKSKVSTSDRRFKEKSSSKTITHELSKEKAA